MTSDNCERFYWKILTPSVEISTKTAKRKMASDHTAFAQTIYSNTENDFQSHRNAFSSDEPLFNKKQKRISRLSACNNSVPCDNKKSDILDRIFQEIEKSVTTENGESSKCVKRNKTSSKRSKKTNPGLSVRKGALYNKVQAETLTIKKNILPIMKQHAHMNVPLTSVQQVVTHNSSISTRKQPSSQPSQFSSVSNRSASLKQTFNLKTYRIPKKKTVQKELKDSNKQNSTKQSLKNIETRKFKSRKPWNKHEKRIVRKRKRKRDREELEREDKQNANKPDIPKQINFVNTKNTTKNTKSQSLRHSRFSIPLSELPKSTEKKQPFEYSHISDVHLKPRRKKVRPLESDSEELEKILHQPHQFIDATNESKTISNIAKASNSTITNNDTLGNITVDMDTGKTESFKANAKFKKTVNFEDYRQYNNDHHGTHIKNVESGIDIKRSKRKIHLIPELQMHSRTTSENSTTLNNFLFEKEIDVITIDDDEVTITDKKIANHELSTKNLEHDDTSNVAAQKLFGKPKAISKTEEIANFLLDYLNSPNKELKEKELLKKITSLPPPACCLCKSTTSLTTCQRCNQIVCRYYCNIKHHCSI